jgi:hypothetical protein
MKAQADGIRLVYTEAGTPEVVLSLRMPPKKAQEGTQKLKEIVAKGKTLDVTIEQHRKKRSLDANSYAWVIISKIAEILKTSKDEVYIEMLRRYGQREPQLISVVEDGVPAVRRATNNHCTEIGQSELNGKTFVHLAILRGSSTYTTAEMAILIDGICSDAREMGIETMTPAELESLKASWKGVKS